MTWPAPSCYAWGVHCPPPPRCTPRPLAALVLLGVLSGCANVAYQPAAEHGFVLDPAADVDDETIASALDATEEPERPKIPQAFRLAYYTFDRQRGDSLRPKLTSLPGVDGIYQIAVDAREAEDNPAVRTRDYLGETPHVSLRRLRLMAAKSRCEVLVVADYGYRHSEDANSWALTAPLILPLFFAPMVDVRTESYLDIYVVDVRSGRLIGQLKSDQLDVWREQTIFHEADSTILDAQWERLRAHTEDEIGKLFADPAAREAPAPPAPEPKKEEPAAPDPFALPADPEAG